MFVCIWPRGIFLSLPLNSNHRRQLMHGSNGTLLYCGCNISTPSHIVMYHPINFTSQFNQDSSRISIAITHLSSSINGLSLCFHSIKRHTHITISQLSGPRPPEGPDSLHCADLLASLVPGSCYWAPAQKPMSQNACIVDKTHTHAYRYTGSNANNKTTRK